MLLQFRLQNHRSLRDETTLSFIANDDAPNDPVVRHEKGVKEGILPVIAIYGANASGKSNVIDAIQFFRRAVMDSHRRWLPDDGVPIAPFLLGPTDGLSTFEVDLLVEGVRHRYGFTASSARIEEEWLERWPQGRKQELFSRNQSNVEYGRNLHGENEIVRAIMRENSLFLSAAAQNNHATLSPVFAQVRMFTGLTRSTSRPATFFAAMAQLETDGPGKAALLGLLQHADTGIVDARVEERRVSYRDGDDSTGRTFRGREISLLHHGDTQAWFPLEAESTGTRTLLQLGAYLFQALGTGSLIFIDELEANLHPILAAKLIQLFRDPATNPKNAQLLLTTHDTNLLGTIETKPLRRDQVWLTEKDPKSGATKLYPVTDFKPRKEENLERGYLQGRYGAIPILGTLLPSSK